MSYDQKNVTFHPIHTIDYDLIKYAVIVTKYQNQWVFCRHRDRDTWEIPGGHREPGESAIETARRELYEETGSTPADISIVGAYRLNDYGLLCFAEIQEIGQIPEDSEIAEIQLVDSIPSNLTYGAVHTQLFHWVQGWLNMQSSSCELWDVYDKDRNLTGRTHRRGEFLRDGDYHLVVHVWLQNEKGEFLITKRSPNKGFPNMWECTGGSALAGDNSLTAAIREVREETGLMLDPDKGRIVLTMQGRDDHNDVWLFRQTFDLADVQLQEGETCDVMYASLGQIRQMLEDGVFVPVGHVKAFLQMAENETIG